MRAHEVVEESGLKQCLITWSRRQWLGLAGVMIEGCTLAVLKLGEHDTAVRRDHMVSSGRP